MMDISSLVCDVKLAWWVNPVLRASYWLCRCGFISTNLFDRIIVSTVKRGAQIGPAYKVEA